MNRRNRSWQLLSVVAVGGVVACSSSAGAPAGAADDAGDASFGVPGGDGSATLGAHTTVIGGASAQDVTVASDHLAFPAATHADILQHKAGDILVGDPGGAGNPYGFLRKVTQTPTQSGSTITVTTTQATLVDAVQEASFKTSLQAPPLTATGPATDFKTRPLLGGGTTIQLLNYSGTKLLALSGSAKLPSGDTVGYTANATVTTGTLSFSPSFDIGATIVPNLSDPIASVQEFHAIGTGELDSDLELNLAMSLTGNMTGADLAQLIAQGVLQQPSATLADYPINLGTISIGIFSIPVHAEFKAVLTCDLSYGGTLGVDVGGKATGQVRAGFEYQNQQFSPVFAHTESFTMIGPNWTADTAAHARCNIKPEFDLSFWDVASGSIWADAHLQLDAAADCSASALTGTVSGNVQAGLDAAAEANVDVMGLFQWQKECTLFDLESPPESVSGTFTLPGGSTTTCTSNPVATLPGQTQPPPSCFGGGSSSGDDGGSSTGDDGGSSSSDDGGGQVVDGCVQHNDPAPSGWTCTAAQYGDCVCNCNCGAPDIDCVAGSCASCDHDACTVGDALGTTCTQDNQAGACIAAICANDSYCCTSGWTLSCIAHITNGDYGCAPTDCPDAGP